jgi:hypothetical protein
MERLQVLKERYPRALLEDKKFLEEGMSEEELTSMEVNNSTNQKKEQRSKDKMKQSHDQDNLYSGHSLTNGTQSNLNKNRATHDSLQIT